MKKNDPTLGRTIIGLAVAAAFAPVYGQDLPDPAARKRELDDIIIVDPVTMLEDPGPNARPSAAR